MSSSRLVLERPAMARWYSSALLYTAPVGTTDDGRFRRLTVHLPRPTHDASSTLANRVLLQPTTLKRSVYPQPPPLTSTSRRTASLCA